MSEVILSPSIMCADLVNLEQDIHQLESLGLTTLHIDVIDGKFSPSMPLGLETIKRMREVTDMDFDIHMMTTDNEFFIQEMLKIGVQNITFHVETSLHLDHEVNLIKQTGTKVSVALNPATSLSILDYLLPELDQVCLMLINPGFATNKGEKQIPYAQQKISALAQLIKQKGLKTKIQVDGRVSLDTIANLVAAGADNLVLGSTSLFAKGATLAENRQKVLDAIAEGKAAK
ncbi:ribulose-phosphate 3-epimerase [Loigolactobacillus bifermentans]|nr:ribulose-phosphate 3-epimerase [Loigolactobacillus bifermentans]QGG60845.1 ribulose-phosphate 3-epimerase [Loigolactobacillus bifermentans]